MTNENYSMRTSSLSVPEVVREIITRNRSIYDCMKMDVINYTALAVKIQPDVERQLGNPVNLNTIVVAIKRYADSFAEKEDVKAESVLKNARLSLTDGILDIRFSSTESAGNSRRPSGTSATPRSTIASGLMPTRSTAAPSVSSAIRPRLGVTIPVMHLISVLLPLPFEPSSATVSPSSTRIETSCSTRTEP